MEPNAAPNRKRKKSRSDLPPKEDRTPPLVGSPGEPELERGEVSREEEEEEGEGVEHLDEDPGSEEDERPPAPKVSKMRSDRYERREHEASTRRRLERPSIKRYDIHSARLSMKKTVRAKVREIRLTSEAGLDRRPVF